MANVKYILSQVDLSCFYKLFKGKSGIYIWTNLKNGKRYIGSSINLGRRVGEYLNPARLAMELKRGDSIISRAMIKYGYLSFSFEVLEIVEIDPSLSDSEKNAILQALEQKYLDELKPEYNILKLAGSNRGHKMSEAARAKISASKKGKPSHRKGETMSQETRDLMQSNSAMKKTVYMYSVNNILLNTFSSIKDCEAFTGISRHKIGRAIKHNKILNGLVFKSDLI